VTELLSEIQRDTYVNRKSDDSRIRDAFKMKFYDMSE
jgi:hypothetical protein